MAVVDFRSHFPDLPVINRPIIDGISIDVADSASIDRTSPATGELFSTTTSATAHTVKEAVASATKAQAIWRRTSAVDKERLLSRVADLIEENLERIALADSLEAGKPITQTRDEISGSVDLWRFAATLTRHDRGESYNSLDSETMAMVVREAMGVVGVITPWNFPFLIASQKIPYALAAGNSIVAKPSEFTPTSMMILAELVAEAGAPAGLVNIVPGAGDIGDLLVKDPQIAMISFTGSTHVGTLVAKGASATLKRTELELGGKNAQIICADADLDAAADAVVFGGLFNAGQCCNAGSRIFVHAEIADEFAQRVATLNAKVKMGNPLDEATKVGTMVNQAQFDKVKNYIELGQNEGARIVGERAAAEFPYISPVLFDGVHSDMSIAHEEIFGPVVVMTRFTELDDVLNQINSSSYGLSSGIWTADLNAAMQAANEIMTGTVWINRWMDGYPELPFGGFKMSGQGRELGVHALDAFSEIKTIQIQVGTRTSRWVESE